MGVNTSSGTGGGVGHVVEGPTVGPGGRSAAVPPHAASRAARPPVAAVPMMAWRRRYVASGVISSDGVPRAMAISVPGPTYDRSPVT